MPGDREVYESIGACAVIRGRGSAVTLLPCKTINPSRWLTDIVVSEPIPNDT